MSDWDDHCAGKKPYRQKSVEVPDEKPAAPPVTKKKVTKKAAKKE